MLGDAAAVRCCSQVGSALHGDGVLHLHLLVGLSGHTPAVHGCLCRAAGAARMSRTDDVLRRALVDRRRAFRVSRCASLVGAFSSGRRATRPSSSADISSGVGCIGSDAAQQQRLLLRCRLRRLLPPAPPPPPPPPRGGGWYPRPLTASCSACLSWTTRTTTFTN